MPFKIVQTIENGETCLTVVPAGWEKNGVLFWPKKSVVAKLAQDENSVPAASWERLNCVKKRVCDTREAAERELAKMEAMSDTETDENPPCPPRMKKPRLPQTQNIRDAGVLKNFNHLIQLPDDDMQEQVITVDESLDPTSENEPETVLLVTEEAAVDGDSYMIIPPIAHASNANIEADSGNVLVAVLEAVNKVHDNQIKMMQGMAAMQTGMEYIAQAVYDNKSSGTAAAKPTGLLSKPVNTLEELNEIEESLKDDTVFQNTVASMTHICGSSGKENSIDVCYKLIEKFMTRDLVAKCSWTGNTRRNDENKSDNVQGAESASKIPLKFYKKFRALFMQLVLLADKDFTEMKCEEFLKRVMKNAKQRLEAKSTTTSAHKDRPKNLKYGTHKDSSTADGASGLAANGKSGARENNSTMDGGSGSNPADS